jgi:lipoprotein-releasing system ATP-binding protein
LSAQSADIRAESLGKNYSSGGSELVVFDNLSFEVCSGELVSIIGESGAGKSTLLHLLGGLDRPSKGRIYFGQQDLSALSERVLAEFRNRTLGFVWQNPSLLPEFTALENVMMPLLIRGREPEEAHAIARARLDEVGLRDRETHRPGELSGGEQQRVAVARALAGSPKVLLADEPTGSLDHRTGDLIVRLLFDLHRAHNLTSIFVTHNLSFAHRCDRVLELRKGSLSVPDFTELEAAGVGRDATRLDGGNYV